MLSPSSDGWVGMDEARSCGRGQCSRLIAEGNLGLSGAQPCIQAECSSTGRRPERQIAGGDRGGGWSLPPRSGALPPGLAACHCSLVLPYQFQTREFVQFTDSLVCVLPCCDESSHVPLPGPPHQAYYTIKPSLSTEQAAVRLLKRYESLLAIVATSQSHGWPRAEEPALERPCQGALAGRNPAAPLRGATSCRPPAGRASGGPRALSGGRCRSPGPPPGLPRPPTSPSGPPAAGSGFRHSRPLQGAFAGPGGGRPRASDRGVARAGEEAWSHSTHHSEQRLQGPACRQAASDPSTVHASHGPGRAGLPARPEEEAGTQRTAGVPPTTRRGVLPGPQGAALNLLPLLAPGAALPTVH